MKTARTTSIGLAILSLAIWLGQPASAVEKSPHLASFDVPVAGDMQIIFQGGSGPFRVQSRTSLDEASPWLDIPGSSVTELEAGVFMAMVPKPGDQVNLNFYRIVSATDPSMELKGWSMMLSVSKPANGSFFAVNESPVVTLTILDNFAAGLTRADFSGLNLYGYGPEDPMKAVTPVKLLNAVTDRTKRPHHYIDLKTNPDAKVQGNVITYNLKPVSDELPGTYTLGVRAVLASDEIQQMIYYAKFQIGNATVEQPVAKKANCAACHEGPISGKMYMHHTDPGRSPVGSWSIEHAPMESCKICHNNDGYAAFTGADGKPVPDNIMIRVHGVHMGEGLKLPFNTNHVDGNFADYTHVVFPKDVRNCTSCHVDDRWKTTPSRMACGTCHDNVWFGGKPVPEGWEEHAKMTDDSLCSMCHPAESGGAFPSIPELHEVESIEYKLQVDVTMSTPANGKYFAAGETPTVSVKVTDKATGLVVDPHTIVEPAVSTNVQPNEWRRANLLVAGPRAAAVPVLTTAATNVPSTSSSAANDFRVRVDPLKEDPRVSRTAEAMVYQLADVAALAPGTYTAYAEVQGSVTRVPGGTTFINFQVGTTNIEKTLTANCTSCHGASRIHTTSRALPIGATDGCNVCHDAFHQMTGKTNWNNSSWGFGYPPLSRLVHGIHYGNYTDKPEELFEGAFANVIFAQDVRNCTKCHQTPAWTEKTSRLACLACHDSNVAQIHGKSNTYDPTPTDPWSGDEVETCELCHAPDDELAPSKVHRISNPFVPIYPRAPRE